MSLVPATVNYSGRQVDLELLQSVLRPVAEQRVYITNVGTVPKIVTGVEKAIQRYTSILLTTLGDVHFDPGTGSTFMQTLVQGGIRNKGYLGHLFGIANAQTLRILARDDMDLRFGVTPRDERIVAGALQDTVIDYASGTVNLTVLLTLAAGDEFVFVVPISTAR